MLTNGLVLDRFLRLRLSSDLQPVVSSDEDVIPGTPVLHSSLPVGGKLRRQRRPEQSKRVRYAEKPLPWFGSSLFNSQCPAAPWATSETSPRRSVHSPQRLFFSQRQTRNVLMLWRNLEGMRCWCQTRVYWTHRRSHVGSRDRRVIFWVPALSNIIFCV